MRDVIVLSRLQENSWNSVLRSHYLIVFCQNPPFTKGFSPCYLSKIVKINLIDGIILERSLRCEGESRGLRIRKVKTISPVLVVLVIFY